MGVIGKAEASPRKAAPMTFGLPPDYWSFCRRRCRGNPGQRSTGDGFPRRFCFPFPSGGVLVASSVPLLPWPSNLKHSRRLQPECIFDQFHVGWIAGFHDNHIKSGRHRPGNMFRQIIFRGPNDSFLFPSANCLDWVHSGG